MCVCIYMYIYTYIYIYIHVYTISKDTGINKKKEICLPNKESISGN